MTSPEVDVRALDVSTYLESTGWQRDGNWRGASVWRLGSEARLLVPDRHEYEDADELIQAAISKIARYEERPERDVRLDIAEPMVDAQYFRTHPDAPPGSTPLPSGLRAVQGVHDLMRAAASTADEGPKLLYEGRRSRQVEMFLGRVLLGAGLPGSYVLTARIPAEPIGQQRLGLLVSEQEFSGRAVVSQLHGALQAARDAAERVLREEHQWAAFYDVVEQGVSANLCKALGDLGGQDKDRHFEIGFAWARALPSQELVKEVAFTDAMPGVLVKAGEELAALAKAGDAQITGLIEDLHNSRDEQPRIKVAGELRKADGSLLPRRAVWVVVSAADYDESMEAHRRDRTVQASGRLSTRRRRLELHATTFRILR
jgi:hypothetical protein